MRDVCRILLRRLTETESLGTPSRKFVYVVKDEDQEDRK
jgi:hypothetical protein